MTVLPHAAHAGNPAAGPAPAHPPAHTPHDPPSVAFVLPAHIDPADTARVELFRRRHALVNSAIYRDLTDALMLARRLAKQLGRIADAYQFGEAGRVLAAAGLDPNPPAGVSWTADQFDDAIADCAGVLWCVEQFACVLQSNMPPGTVRRAEKGGVA